MLIVVLSLTMVFVCIKHAVSLFYLEIDQSIGFSTAFIYIILKALNLKAYSCIKNKAVPLLQNSTLLLTLFSSPTLALYDVIRIIWAEQ